MLVLSRKIGETVVIGGVEVTIVSIARGKVKLGVEAPLEVKIMRKELVDESPDQKLLPEDEK